MICQFTRHFPTVGGELEFSILLEVAVSSGIDNLAQIKVYFLGFFFRIKTST
jgi:hypothetical protein